MTPKLTAVLRSVASIAIVVGAAVPALQAESAPQKLIVGDAKVDMIHSYQGPELPKPDQVVVCNFPVSPDAITMDQSAAARLLGHGVLARIKGDSNNDASPEAVAEHVEGVFSKALVSELGKTSMPTTAAQGDGTTPPNHTLIVEGEFTTVNQGNKSKRIMIGFGRGASDVQAHVTVLLTTDTQPIVVAEFNLNSASGKKPGAAATMGVGSAAAGVAAGSVGDKKETVEGDASRMAKAVAKQIIDQMTAQQWIAAQQQQAKN
jgi:hypothetical protein